MYGIEIHDFIYSIFYVLISKLFYVENLWYSSATAEPRLPRGDCLDPNETFTEYNDVVHCRLTTALFIRYPRSGLACYKRCCQVRLSSCGDLVIVVQMQLICGQGKIFG